MYAMENSSINMEVTRFFWLPEIGKNQPKQKIAEQFFKKRVVQTLFKSCSNFSKMMPTSLFLAEKNFLEIFNLCKAPKPEQMFLFFPIRSGFEKIANPS